MKLYREFKNHLHNTLGISKDDIRAMVDKAVEKSVERRLDVLFRDKYEDKYTMERIIDEHIEEKSLNWWGESSDTLNEYIKKEVVQKLLSGVNLKVEVTQAKKRAVPGVGVTTTRIYKRKAPKL